MTRNNKTFNARKYIVAAKGIGGRWNRITARLKGSSDGRANLYGSFDADFENRCQWIQTQRSAAAENYAEAKQHVQQWQRVKEGELENHSERLAKVQADIASKMNEAEIIYCKRPTFTRFRRTILFGGMFLAEFLITVAALWGSNAMSQGGQIGFALVVAAAFVWLSEHLSERIRMRPLPRTATLSQRRHHDLVIITLAAALVVALVLVNMVRARAATDAMSADHPFSPVMQWALLAVGACLICIGIFNGSSDEFSGPKFGLRKLEDEVERLNHKISGCNTSLRRLADYLVNLDTITRNNIAKIFAIYRDHYRRSSMMNESGAGNSKPPSNGERQPGAKRETTWVPEEAEGMKVQPPQHDDTAQTVNRGAHTNWNGYGPV